MGTVVTLILGLGIAYLVVINIKKGIRDAQGGRCSGCAKDCTSGSCDLKE